MASVVSSVVRGHRRDQTTPKTELSTSSFHTRKALNLDRALTSSNLLQTLRFLPPPARSKTDLMLQTTCMCKETKAKVKSTLFFSFHFEKNNYKVFGSLIFCVYNGLQSRVCSVYFLPALFLARVFSEQDRGLVNRPPFVLFSLRFYILSYYQSIFEITNAKISLCPLLISFHLVLNISFVFLLVMRLLEERLALHGNVRSAAGLAWCIVREHEGPQPRGGDSGMNVWHVHPYWKTTPYLVRILNRRIEPDPMVATPGGMKLWHSDEKIVKP